MTDDELIARVKALRRAARLVVWFGQEPADTPGVVQVPATAVEELRKALGE